jgi:hypothetical protein
MYVFLTSTLVGGEWPVSHPCCFTPRRRNPWYPLDRRLGGPHSRSGWYEEVKILVLKLRPHGRRARSHSLYRLRCRCSNLTNNNILWSWFEIHGCGRRISVSGRSQLWSFVKDAVKGIVFSSCCWYCTETADNFGQQADYYFWYADAVVELAVNPVVTLWYSCMNHYLVTL